MFFRSSLGFACALALFSASPDAEQPRPVTARPARSGSSVAGQNGHPATNAVPAALRALSLHDRIAQLFVVRGYGDYPSTSDPEYQRFLKWIRDDRVGGFIVAGRIRNGSVINAQPFEMAAFVNRMQRIAKTPLFVGSDFERGASGELARPPAFLT